MFVEWQFPAFTSSAPPEFIAALRPLHPVTARVLYARGWHDPAAARAHWSGAYECVDPAALPEISRAAERLLAAIEALEPIAVYGDYDCDGVTACALLATTLRALGAEPRVYIPDRFAEGYGLHAHALDRLADDGARVVVTVDCGARAVNEARRARERGIDLIITDHHAPGPAHPQAFAFVSPYADEGGAAWAELAGVGLAFRLAQCLLRAARRRGRRPALTERALLDLVAIGTVADVAPMRSQNRALVRVGLAEIDAHPRPGVRALLRAVGFAGAVDASVVGFTIAPHLNAAGRVGSARIAFDLLMAQDDVVTERLAAELVACNARRRAETAQVVVDAERSAVDPAAPLLFAASEQYSAGVIGLAAARLAERRRCPAVVAALVGDEARGSCRSVPGFDMIAALDRCADLLTRHGGHAAAAGFSMPRAALPDLQERLRAIAAEQQPSGGWQRHPTIDAEVAAGDLGPALYRELAQLRPHGAGNPRPLLLARGMRVVGAQTFGADGAHVRLRLRDSGGAVWSAMAWRAGAHAADFVEEALLDVLFHLAGEERDGALRLWLEVRGMRRRTTDG
jgi:single-stranded-DNA-specific exonuclease